MKKLLEFIFVAILAISYSCCSNQQSVKEPVVLAYVTSWSSIMPDPTYLTHINYSFGHVNETFNGVIINRPPREGSNENDGRPTSEDRLRSIVELKKQKPSLKIMLSIGGWGSGRFSEMAADEKNRLAFAADCRRVVKEFGLDGIDMDWEYPTSSMARISSSPEDTDNFTLLMRDIRNAIGKNKLLTFASSANAKYVDFKAIDKYVDFINIMTYDMGVPPYHHSALFPSEHSELSCQESVDLHIAAGIAPNKLTLGMPFYGKGGIRLRFWEIPNQTEYTDNWDDVAKVPYLTDSEGKFVLTYENARSIAIKCEWLKERGLLGAMYWEYSSDDSEGTLRKTVFNGVMGK